MSPDDPSLHVPPGERRKFIARCVGLWTAAALVWGACASLRHWEDVKEWAFGGALMAAVLVAQGLLERRLRRRWLPPAGQTLWCLRVALLAPVFSALVVWASKPLGSMIPGYFRASNEGTMSSVTRIDGQPIRIDFEEELRSLPSLGFRLPDRYAPHRLRFHPCARPDETGWGIRQGERTLVNEDGTATLPMSGTGLLEVLEDLGGRAVPASERAAMESQLDRLAADWLGGRAFHSFTPSSGDRWTIGVERSSRDHPAAWSAPVVGALVLGLIILAIASIAAMTLGDGGPEPKDPR